MGELVHLAQPPFQPALANEVLLLRAVYRAASAHLAAPYLKEHEDALREAVTAYHDARAAGRS